MSSAPLSVIIEAVLFFSGGARTLRELEKATGAGREAIEEALQELKAALEGRGIMLVRTDGSVALATSPEVATEIEAMRREELEGPLGRAGLETLAVIMYRGPVSRADIEYVRGVNVFAALRSLMIRGLVERVENPGDKRSFLYRVTADVPAYLGISAIEELPEYAAVRAQIDAVTNEQATHASEQPPA